MTDDVAWLGLERTDDHTWSFELASHLGRHDQKLYGGTGLAVSVALMEAATDRDALWTTVQFSGSANVGERLDCVVDVHAAGRRSSQLQVTARVGDRLVFSALGATGEHNLVEPLEVQVPVKPEVPGPDGVRGLGGPTRDPRRGASSAGPRPRRCAASNCPTATSRCGRA